MRVRGTVLCLLLISGLAYADSKPIDFAHEVVPVLKKHCIECHGGGESKGGFSLNTRDLILESEAAVPGKSAESRIIELLVSTDVEEQMPPKDRSRLSPAEIDVIRNWIDQGLPWESGFSFVERRYEPPLHPRRPELPPAIDGRNHPIDRIIDSYLATQKVSRPASVSDAVFVRRAYLDVVGLLPEPQRVEEFLSESSPDKRQQLIRDLLADDVAYAEHWLTFWNDLLRNDYSGTGFITGGRKQITAWLYQSLLNNKPYDRFVRELINPAEEASGFILGIRWRGNVNASQTQEIQFAQNIGQAFLGINLKCASCHDSFIDRWKLEETYGLAQIYATQPLELHRCDKPIGKEAKAAWIFPELGQIDASADQPTRLRQLAELMTHPENGRFTRTIVNRIWHRLMGRGIVHPVDAMETSPWSEDLLDYLATYLSDHNYDLKKVIELICTSEAYQAQSPAWNENQSSGNYVYRGPVAKRMTAEQFMDTVWQVTGSAPSRFDAAVLRFKVPESQAAVAEESLTGKWIWSDAEAFPNIPAGESRTFRKRFDLKANPELGVAAITCDNEYTLYVNGKLVQSDNNWETVELINLQPHMREGRNELMIVAKNAGATPNPAGLFFEAYFRQSDGIEVKVGSDAFWQWSSTLPDARGKLQPDPRDWKAASVIRDPQVWSGRVANQLVAGLKAAAETPPRMVRASLMKNDAFMTSLGRPNRDQIVSMRPSELTTLEAIDLANGQVLADAIAAGASRLVKKHEADAAQGKGKLAESLARHIYMSALSRQPTAEELSLMAEMLGDAPTASRVEDLLWSVFMLPEFQLIR